MSATIACIGHQELRDMVIELRADVKHIDERITNLVEVAKTNNERIVCLETYQNQTIGKAKGMATSATIMSVVVSTVISAVAVVVSLMVR